MVGLVFLIVGALLATIGRIMLAVAAFGISFWWGLGVFLPFGPVVFRLSYPEEAEGSRLFRLAAVPCLLVALTLGPVTPATIQQNLRAAESEARPMGFASEKPAKVKSVSNWRSVSNKNLEERRAANTREMERLRAWNDKLRLWKRDLLNSDVQGNRAYNAEFSQYNADFAKANAEKVALFPATK